MSLILMHEQCYIMWLSYEQINHEDVKEWCEQI